MSEEPYGPATYGDRIAEAYDAMHSHLDPAAAIEALARLAGGGRLLELGIGTGRIALPLIVRGVEVHGVDASEAMVAELRSKPGGADIPVAIGDFADMPVEGAFEALRSRSTRSSRSSRRRSKRGASQTWRTTSRRAVCS